MGEWASLLHEIGHRIDTLYGDISHTNIFRKALENDFEKTVKSVMIGLNYDRDQAYRYISSILETKVCFSFISDIYGGLSENKCWGGFGHTKKYWGEPNNLTMEAFANFFSAYARRDNLEIDYLQQAFPTATKVFLRIMERIAK